MTQPAILTSTERTAALGVLPDWQYNLGALQTVYACPTVTDALALIQAIGERAESLDHHPDVDWRYRHVFATSSTHSVGRRVTAKDIELATAISAAAALVGARAAPELVRSLELGIDTADPTGVVDTWTAALGYRTNAAGDLVDPWGRLPSVWFQETDDPNPSRLHVDLTVDANSADAILAEVEGHGGRRIDDRFRPSFTVVADAQDNRICICTNLGRTE